MKNKKRSIGIFLVFLLSNCITHKYLLEPRNPANASTHEVVYMKSFFIVGLLPHDSLQRSNDYCLQGEHITSINLYDSAFDGAICGGTLFIYCPHTIAIACAKNAESGVLP